MKTTELNFSDFDGKTVSEVIKMFSKFDPTAKVKWDWYTTLNGSEKEFIEIVEK
jgi:hypothetical protein